MRFSRLLFVLGRIAVIVFFLLSSLFAILAYIPFTYQQVHKAGLVPWFKAFGPLQARLYWLALAIACATLASDFRRSRVRWLAAAFAVVHTVAGVLLLYFPVMATIRPDASSWTWAMLSMEPLAAIAAIDFASSLGRIQWTGYAGEDDRRIFRAAWQSAIFVAIVYDSIFYLRAAVTWGIWERLAALSATLLCHLLVFGVLFAALNLVRSLASLTPWPSPVEFALSNLLTAGIGFGIVSSLVFRPLSFEGPLALGYSVTVSLTLVACLAGMGARFWRPERGAVTGLTLALTPVTLPNLRNRYLKVVPLLGLGVAAWALAVNTAIMDWNYMFQKLTACAIWVMSFGCIYAIAPTPKGVQQKRFTILFWIAMTMTGYRLAAAAFSEHPTTAAALEKYAGYDASFRLIRDALSAPAKDNTFYKFLSMNTNIARSVSTPPVDVEMAGKLTPSAGPKPNIFIVVMDSFRRDYVGAYNSAVDFTPAIDAFARESVVFHNTFTRYGGTGLAEPSIWVGGMTLHKQYITPFHPMNALGKLTDAEQYRSYLSMDTILRAIVKPPPDLVELDENNTDMNCRLCSSLADLETKLNERGPAGLPAFAYTQPQDIHISVINRERNSVVDEGAYRGFYAPYASRVRRFDPCFGKFIQYLKDRGIYDNSVVVLTADHGDSLGEDGRWGHAYTLVPEVVRVPFIVHLPKKYQGLSVDPNAVTFQSDITPSLYYLLGHKPTLHADFYGRPLFTETATEQQSSRQDSYLIAASYAAVYGIVKNNGKALYTFDAVNYKDSYFEMSDLHSQSKMMSATQRTEGEEAIRKGIGAINAFYKFQPH